MSLYDSSRVHGETEVLRSHRRHRVADVTASRRRGRTIAELDMELDGWSPVGRGDSRTRTYRVVPMRSGSPPRFFQDSSRRWAGGVRSSGLAARLVRDRNV